MTAAAAADPRGWTAPVLAASPAGKDPPRCPAALALTCRQDRLSRDARRLDPAPKIYYILCLIALATQRIVAVRPDGKDYFIHMMHRGKGPNKQPLVKILPFCPRLLHRFSTALSTTGRGQKINPTHVAELRQTEAAGSCKQALQRNNPIGRCLNFRRNFYRLAACLFIADACGSAASARRRAGRGGGGHDGDCAAYLRSANSIALSSKPRSFAARRP